MDTTSTSAKLQQILDKHEHIFADELGTLKGLKAHIVIDEGASPWFHKARPLPYAMRAKVEDELKKLQREGVISPVQFSDWATPIVVITKPDRII